MRVVIHNHIARDGLAERIAGARALYERPGTPGERAAAEAALRRMGVDPRPKAPSAEPKAALGPKIYFVELGVRGRNHGWSFAIAATDEIDAEMKARKKAKADWKMTTGKSISENDIDVRSTKRQR